MSASMIQVILTLQYLKMNNKEIDSFTSQDLLVSDSSSLSDSIQHNSRLPSNKQNAITPGSVENAWDLSKEIIQCSLRQGVQIIGKTDTTFPIILRELSDCPHLLHVKGDTKILNSDCIAVVGTRNPTQFGREKAGQLSSELAKTGITIVSGLAKGIDTAAHEGALKSEGCTIAVLAHGLQTVYPAENRGLATRILNQNGALVSEYPWYTTILPRYLVARDRIQSGMSRGVMVIETGVKGGTMHTVKNCVEQNRLLMVLHHPPGYDTDENTLGNKEITKKYSGSGRFYLIGENDDAKIIIERMQDFQKDIHHSDESLPTVTGSIHAKMAQDSGQTSIPWCVRENPPQCPDDAGFSPDENRGFMKASDLKKRTHHSKRDQKSKKTEISMGQKTLGVES